MGPRRVLRSDADVGFDLLQLALDGTRRVTPLLQTKFDERNGIVSPDGRWLAYESNSSGPTEIYVRPFPKIGDGQWLVSTAGGTRPLWARSGKELFYVVQHWDEELKRLVHPAATRLAAEN